jgi:hypothetical protein
MKTQNSQEPPPAWMEDALAMMELSAEVAAALAAAAGNDDPLKYFPGYAEACAKAEANPRICPRCNNYLFDDESPKCVCANNCAVGLRGSRRAGKQS